LRARTRSSIVSGVNTGNEISILYCANGCISVCEKFCYEASESDLTLFAIALSREVIQVC
jgi:hypothetical protein